MFQRDVTIMLLAPLILAMLTLEDVSSLQTTPSAPPLRTATLQFALQRDAKPSEMQNAESNLHNVFAISLQTLASKSPAFLEKIFNHNVFPASRVALMETNALPITATSRLELVFTRERTPKSAPRLQFAPKMLIA
jgi:hypothetical protein